MLFDKLPKILFFNQVFLLIGSLKYEDEKGPQEYNFDIPKKRRGRKPK
jgi:hypothetical protein